MIIKVVKFLLCFVVSGFIGAGIFLLAALLTNIPFGWVGWLFVAYTFGLFGILGVTYWYTSLKQWCRLAPW